MHTSVVESDRAGMFVHNCNHMLYNVKNCEISHMKLNLLKYKVKDKHMAEN